MWPILSAPLRFPRMGFRSPDTTANAMKTRLSVLALSFCAAAALATGCDAETPLPDDPADFDRASEVGGHCGGPASADEPQLPGEFEPPPSGEEGGEPTKELPGETVGAMACTIACEYQGEERAPYCSFLEADDSLLDQIPAYAPDDAACVDVSSSGTEYLFYQVGDLVPLLQSVASAQCRADGAFHNNSVNVWNTPG